MYASSDCGPRLRFRPAPSKLESKAQVTKSGKARVSTNTAKLKVHEYVELADGLSFWDETAGAWVDSVPEFEAVNNKGFVALRGQIQVILSATLQSGGVDILTPSGRFRGHCLGLSYFDAATGKNVTLATLRAVEGELIAPNQVLYPDCFEGEGVKASLLYTIHLNRLEQDVILHDALGIKPADCGFDPKFTRLTAITEWLDLPEVKITPQIIKASGCLLTDSNWPSPIL